MKIVVLDGYAVDPGDNPISELEQSGEVVLYPRTSEADVVARARDADILILNKTRLRAEILSKLPRLKFVSVMATGYDVVAVAAARERGIIVSNVPSYGTDTVAQYVFALILELCHHVGEHAASVARGEWATASDWCYWLKPQIELNGLTLGIVGFGRIGKRVAELAAAFGMRVVYTSRPQDSETAFAQQVSLEEVFRQADFLSLHCSLSESNRGFVNRALLTQMKRSAFLINTARGPLIHEADLAEALHNGTLAGAALDVLNTEPPGADNPLVGAPNCIITPHIAWATLAARQRIAKVTIENVRAFLAGSPIHVVSG